MPAALTVAGAAVGALAGAAVPWAAYRLSVERSAPPRSACGRCAAPFPAGLAGWVRPTARCPSCRVRLGPPRWLTSAAGAVTLGVLCWALDPGRVLGADAPGPTGADPSGRATLAAAFVLAAFVLAGLVGVLLGAIDLACLRLPDLIVGPTFVAVLLVLGAAAAVGGTSDARSDLTRGLAAALAMSGGYLVLAVLPGAGLGLGDVKLSGLLGLLLGWLGWGAVLLGAVLPHLLNAPVVLALLLVGRAGRRSELPLGPALLAGALLAVASHAALIR
jgi:leader peptidase (prepilin peptidase)/N-methyltransferase